MSVRVQQRGRQDYQHCWQAMREFTDARDEHTDDEVWLLEHDPVYTLGLAGRREHVLASTGDTPLVQSDRGGQVTFHGPGQLVIYLLLDLKRLGIGVKVLVERTEQAVIDMLAAVGLVATRRPGAPGVYVDGAKIAALGYRIRRGCCYHGLALNVDLDLQPFTLINPCGYAGLAVTSLQAQGVALPVNEAGNLLLAHLFAQLGLAAAAGQRSTATIKSGTNG
jgi:lipoyl(octanoyl) transferase